jgi:hypothetical protein
VHCALEIAFFDAAAFFHYDLSASGNFGDLQQLLLLGFSQIGHEITDLLLLLCDLDIQGAAEGNENESENKSDIGGVIS